MLAIGEAGTGQEFERLSGMRGEVAKQARAQDDVIARQGVVETPHRVDGIAAEQLALDIEAVGIDVFDIEKIMGRFDGCVVDRHRRCFGDRRTLPVDFKIGPVGDKDDAVIGFHRLKLAFDAVWQKQIVERQERDERAMAFAERGVEVAGNVSGIGLLDETRGKGAVPECFADDLGVTIGGSIIDDDQLQIAVRLIKYRVQRRGRIGCLIVGYAEDGDEVGHEVFRLLLICNANPFEQLCDLK